MQTPNNHTDKVLKSANNCTLLDEIKFKSEETCTFKTLFFSSVLGRKEKGYTQSQAAQLLKVSKRTIVELEKGNSNNLVLTLNYIHLFSHKFI